ncbi:SHOCT domain-containing protein [Chryseobacterium sp. OV279]|uniref:SHOCT domain-containing protein n=1 Tax=Chryseobacterium sp. OV279 TaxID=1500285 RepID=UPI000934527E|nr:SHOCT domain-containing protein [Chryseobacterium sp. OV279]
MMENIQYQIRKINPDLFSWAQSEMSNFSDFLMESENIIHIIDGIYDYNAVFLLSTNQRLILKGIGTDFIDVIPHEKITLINYLEPQEMVSVYTDDKVFGIGKVDEMMASQFNKKVNTFIFGNREDIAEEENDHEESVFVLLEQLGKLRQGGILTEEEFSSQKKKLLEKL